MIYCKLVLIVQ